MALSLSYVLSRNYCMIGSLTEQSFSKFLEPNVSVREMLTPFKGKQNNGKTKRNFSRVYRPFAFKCSGLTLAGCGTVLPLIAWLGKPLILAFCCRVSREGWGGGLTSRGQEYFREPPPHLLPLMTQKCLESLLILLWSPINNSERKKRMTRERSF